MEIKIMQKNLWIGLGLVTNGKSGGTMHDSLPNLGRDPYDDIAGSF